VKLEVQKALSSVSFDEMKDKTFTIVRVVEKLCEVCDKPLRTEETTLKTVQIVDYNSYSSLLSRQRAHDRVEVDLEEKKIYQYHHDYPGDVHKECIEKL
jgi:hypothetical protein